MLKRRLASAATAAIRLPVIAANNDATVNVLKALTLPLGEFRQTTPETLLVIGAPWLDLAQRGMNHSRALLHAGLGNLVLAKRRHRAQRR